MNKLNACINYLSSRTVCIKPSLDSLWKNYNYKHNYPVYVYYFDDIYDSENLRKEICSSNDQNVIFRSVPYKTPSFIEQEDLFYNRRDIWYVRNRFPIWRKGYLHMINFKCNLLNYENTDFHKYDYILMHDDEAGYLEEMQFDPFEVIKNKDNLMGAYWFRNRAENGISQGNIDTTIGLWDLTKKFIHDKNLEIKSLELKSLFNDPMAHHNINGLPILGTYVIKTKMFDTKLWKDWLKTINESGGIYRYRWGDNDIYTLFMLMTENGAYDFEASKLQYHDVYKFRGMQDIAPGVKDVFK
jgi:hypothetical protein